MAHEPLFDRVLSDVFEGLFQPFFIQDLFARVASLPERTVPIVYSGELAREITLEVAHKLRERWCILAAEQEVEVIAEKDVVMEFNRLLVHMKRVTKDTLTDRDDLGPWLKKSEALQAARDDMVCRPLGRLIAEMMSH